MIVAGGRNGQAKLVRRGRIGPELRTTSLLGLEARAVPPATQPGLAQLPLDPPPGLRRLLCCNGYPVQWPLGDFRLTRTCPWLALSLVLASTHAPAVEVDPWPLPVAGRAAQPNLVATPKALYLSWIEPGADGEHRLRFARDRGQGFEPPRQIAAGRDWFVNWADFPALAALPDGSLAAHFLQKSADTPYAYDVRLTRSRDGEQWSAPVTVHDDGTPSEHGFVSLWPWSEQEIAIAWLDGRASGGGHGGHGPDGAMSLRGAVFDAGGKREEWELDTRTCDCCQTDVAVAANGPVLVYRDRAEGEIRDIAITRWRDGAWTTPAPVHADRWTMPACPVNGPTVAAAGNDVYVAWYTAADGAPELRVAHSRDDGARFEAPQTLARGGEVQGRVDLALDATSLYVSWLSEDTQKQTLWLARYARDMSGAPERVEVATLARGRGTGFPRLALRGDVTHLVWTDIVDRQPRLRGARLRFDSAAKE